MDPAMALIRVANRKRDSASFAHVDHEILDALALARTHFDTTAPEVVL